MSNSDVALTERVATRFAALVPSGTKCLIAVSGGADSMALLDILHATLTSHGSELVVAHVNHGIQRESAAAVALVSDAARSRGLELHVRELHLGAGTSETVARAARRTALTAVATESRTPYIVLAHHADDQVETVLLRILRGSGPAGLAGMAARHGRWIRPLLGVRKAELVAHVESRRLSWWVDPANSDRRHLRSWLRAEVLPLLLERLPDVTAKLGATARQSASARHAWAQVLHVLPGLEVQRSDRGISVAAPVLRGYRSALRHAVLAAAGRECGALVGARRLAAIDRLLASDRNAGTVSIDGAMRAELSFGRLTFYRSEAVAADNAVLSPDAPVVIAGAKLRVSVGRGRRQSRTGMSADMIAANYRVRRWRAGDRIRPLGSHGSRTVAVLLREARIAPSRRRAWPVVVAEDDATIVWVPGICRSDVAVPVEGTEAWCVECAFT